MRLKLLRLVNYCQFRDTTIRFDGNLIGVVGSIGSGKSNVLSAIELLLVGRASNASLSDMLRWGQPEGEIALELEAGDSNVQILRKLGQPAVQLEIDGRSYKASEGYKRLEELLGAPVEALQQVSFLRQGEFASMLFGPLSQRKDALQRLFGLKRLQGLRDLIMQQLSTITVQDFSEPLGRALEEQERLKNTMASLSEAIAAEEKELPALEQKIAELTEALRATKAGDKLCEVEQQLDSLQKEKIQLETAEKALQQRLLDVDPTALEAELGEIELTLNDHAELSEQLETDPELLEQSAEELEINLRKQRLHYRHLALTAEAQRLSELEEQASSSGYETHRRGHTRKAFEPAPHGASTAQTEDS